MLLRLIMASSIIVYCAGQVSAQAVGTVLGVPNTLTTACTSTKYIDYDTGDDTNPGTKVSPWKRHPYMKGWLGSYTHAAGDCFIFKGGVTWPNATLTLKIIAGGSASGTYDYYGVDETWYTGGAWARPIFDAEGAVPNGVHIVHLACDSSALDGYITIDSIELKGLLVDNAGSGASILLSNCPEVMVNNVDIHDWQIGSSGGTADANNRGGIGHGVSAGTSIANTVVQNSHIHNEEGCLRATIVSASRTSNVATVTVSAAVIANWIANGSTKIVVEDVSDSTFNTGNDVQNTTAVTSTTFSYNNTGPDVGSFGTGGSVKSACGVAIQYMQTIAYNEVNANAQFMLHGGYDVHDNYVHDNWGTYCNCGSTNNLFNDSWDGAVTPTHLSAYIYRNKIVNSNLGTSYYPVPCTNNYYLSKTNMYFFNNIMVWDNNHTSNYAVNIDPVSCGLTADVTIHVYNNTLRLTSSDVTACGRITPRASQKIKDLYVKNNHCIFDGGSPWTFDAQYLQNAAVLSGNYVASNASATSNGYILGNLYRPSTETSPTVGVGDDLHSLCTGILTALCQDFYGQTRSGAWDAGAYQWPGRKLLWLTQ